jgi:hypothetical protein
MADVHTLPGAEYDEMAILIQEAVRDHGPFDMFGVSLVQYTLASARQFSSAQLLEEDQADG